jgi:hypothetical protein
LYIFVPDIKIYLLAFISLYSSLETHKFLDISPALQSFWKKDQDLLSENCSEKLIRKKQHQINDDETQQNAQNRFKIL